MDSLWNNIIISFRFHFVDTLLNVDTKIKKIPSGHCRLRNYH
nr:MAG TPA: hypothetical protein [Caudoviricetes sp.]